MTNQIAAIIGKTAYDSDHHKVGKIQDIFEDEQSHQPTWVTITSGLFGSKQTFVPLALAHAAEDEVIIDTSKNAIADAPQIDVKDELSPQDEQILYKYYQAVISDSHMSNSTVEGHDTSGPTTDNAMTRSEEELRVSTERVETGRVKLKKYVVTENKSVTVPTQHEEVRLEREPITDENMDQAMDGPAISEEEHEITLHGDKTVVDKVAVPKERVKMTTEQVQNQQEVSDTIRKEQIHAEEQ